MAFAPFPLDFSMKTKLMLALGAVLAFSAAGVVQHQKADAKSSNEITLHEILHDPRIPAEGNSEGDLTIVEYFDYQCSSCKQVNPVLQEIAREDGHIRLVFKDWPIFGDTSIFAARLGIAAKFQNKFPEAHRALISAQGSLSKESVLKVLAEAGIDVTRAQRDLEANRKEIDAILAGNQKQASALGFEGPPAFMVGRVRIPAVFNTANFKDYIAKARALP